MSARIPLVSSLAFAALTSLPLASAAPALKYPKLKPLVQGLVGSTPLVLGTCPKLNLDASTRAKADVYCARHPNNIPWGLISNPVPEFLAAKGFKYLEDPENLWVSQEDGSYRLAACNTQKCSKVELAIYYAPPSAFSPNAQMLVYVIQH